MTKSPPVHNSNVFVLTEGEKLRIAREAGVLARKFAFEEAKRRRHETSGRRYVSGESYYRRGKESQKVIAEHARETEQRIRELEKQIEQKSINEQILQKIKDAKARGSRLCRNWKINMPASPSGLIIISEKTEENTIKVTASVFREAQTDTIQELETFDLFNEWIWRREEKYNQLLPIEEQLQLHSFSSNGIGRDWEAVVSCSQESAHELLGLQDTFRTSHNHLKEYNRYCRQSGKGIDNALMTSDGKRLVDYELKSRQTPTYQNRVYITLSWIRTHILPRFHNTDKNPSQKTVLLYTPYEVIIKEQARTLLKIYQIELIIIHNSQELFQHLIKTIIKQLTKLNKLYKLTEKPLLNPNQTKNAILTRASVKSLPKWRQWVKIMGLDEKYCRESLCLEYG